ncbi:hypothetical protein [Clostridium oryzae]|uniref:Uncharacterized protein n=1 Tax=Clostridium oryzae TaxID=1450648 RepID=A0A1V4I3L5_9CLOT|nr:hypothetical protein [Clostridium oryzae]OPJ54568.1 hypothetical protein CLORY_45590 [Clostridium oryzae]
MAKQIYRTKSSMSLKQFIAEFGENFSDHMKNRLMELESRGFLTRKEYSNRFDLKHVEHIQYKCSDDLEGDSSEKLKEYSYAQLEVDEGILYFSDSCFEDNMVKQSPMVDKIYNSLDSECVVSNYGNHLKKIDDSNIDYVIDNILLSCPDVSKSYLEIVKGMTQRANN